jgi:hypothetical protein
MVSRHHQTSLSSQQPVRFYKIIAISFLVITLILLGIIVFMSSKRAEIVIVAKPTPVDVSTDVKIGSVSGGSDIEGVVTSTVVSVTKSFQVTGNREEPALAGGNVTLQNDSPSAQGLVATTRLLSDGGVLFRLKNAVTVPANGKIVAEVYADKPGKEGNIGPAKFTIPGLNEARQKQVYAMSEAPMSGGMKTVGSLGSDDFESAKRSFADALQKQGESVLGARLGDKKAVFTLESYDVTSTAQVGATVSSFDLIGSGTVVGIFYDNTEMTTLAKSLLAKRAIDNSEIIETNEKDPTVTFAEYNKEKMVATVHLFYDGVATLNPQSKQIDRTMFFGKNKEEVRRYLLTLDHVHSVDVQFHPAWMQSVPHITDHVQVTVKEVE